MRTKSLRKKGREGSVGGVEEPDFAQRFASETPNSGHGALHHPPQSAEGEQSKPKEQWEIGTTKGQSPTAEATCGVCGEKPQTKLSSLAPLTETATSYHEKMKR
jgi:hypothetical protein